MRKTKTQGQAVFLALTLSLFLCLGLSTPANAEGLGIGVTIVPYSGDDGLSGGNDKLWFPIEPGESFERELRITSESDLRQVVSILLFDSIIENGLQTADFSKESQLTSWLELEENNFFILEPRATINIPIRLLAPDDAQERAFEGTLRVLASEFGDDDGEQESGGVKAVVKGAIAIDLAFWVGVGDYLDLLPSFDIVNVEGVLIENTKYLRVYFDNTGLSPIKLKGTVQFSDPTFVDRSFDPTSYVSQEISSKERGFADVLINQEITDGKWSVFVLAEQDGIRQTKLFEGEIRFLPPGSVPPWLALLFQLGLGLLSLVGAVIGLRALRSGASKSRIQKYDSLSQGVPDTQNVEVLEATRNQSTFELLTLKLRESKLKTKGKLLELKNRPAKSKKSAVRSGDQITDNRTKPYESKNISTSLKGRAASKIDLKSSYGLEKSKPSVEEFDDQLSDWAEQLKRSLREVRADSQLLVEKYNVSPANPEKTISPRVKNSTNPASKPSGKKVKAKISTSKSRTTGEKKTAGSEAASKKSFSKSTSEKRKGSVAKSSSKSKTVRVSPKATQKASSTKKPRTQKPKN